MCAVFSRGLFKLYVLFYLKITHAKPCLSIPYIEAHFSEKVQTSLGEEPWTITLPILFQSYQVSKSHSVISLITEIFSILIKQKLFIVLGFQDCMKYHQLDGVLFCCKAFIMFAFNLHAQAVFREEASCGETKPLYGNATKILISDMNFREKTFIISEFILQR